MWSVRRTALLAAAAAAAACVQPVGPARTADDYELKAKDTAETVLSAVGTAELVVDVATRDRAFPPYVSVSLSEAESEAEAALSTFESIQPPGTGTSSDRLRDDLTELAGDAVDVLADSRIAARRVDDDALAATAGPLDDAHAELEAFIEEHS